MPLLKVSNVSKSFGKVVALQNTAIKVEIGEVHILIGSNGCGKSTLCKIIAGSVRPDRGSIQINDQPVSFHSPIDAFQAGIGVFYQELSLSKLRTVGENIFLGNLPVNRLGLVDQKKLKQRATAIMKPFAEVVGADFHPGAIISDLREDQRQIVEILKTISTDAKILIFDEPTSSLDRKQVKVFFELIGRLRKQGKAIIFISHRLDEVFEIGDKITVMRDANTVAELKVADTDKDSIVHLMVGQKIEYQNNHQETLDSERKTVLDIQHLSGSNFDDVSFEMKRGEILGFGGLHGQGQSDILQTIFGVRPATNGKIVVKGQVAPKMSPHKAVDLGFAYISGDRVRQGIIQNRPIVENLSPVSLVKNRHLLFSRARMAEKSKPVLKQLNTLFSGFETSVNNLSGGNQQKIVISRWLIDNPEILLLDDPTKGIDLQAKADLFSMIRQLLKTGVSIILYSSEDEELLNNTDRVLVFHGGEITRELVGDERTEFNLYQAAFGDSAKLAL